jgi:6-pyruvoyltetrahydropterin/6-carboxytetrahydropterin synthase
MLTINRRFDFAAAHRSYRDDWSFEKNLAYYGNGAKGDPGHGHNYQVFFVLSGPLDPMTGMVMELSTLKRVIEDGIIARYDHKFLNLDVKPFDKIPPTSENLAWQLLDEAKELFANNDVTPVACHVIETAKAESTAYSDGGVERHIKKTMPICVERSGNKYIRNAHIRITIKGELDPLIGVILQEEQVQAACWRLRKMLAGKDLSQFAFFDKQPQTQEMITQFIWEELSGSLPVVRVKMDFDDVFFTEYLGAGEHVIACKDSFYALHKLWNDRVSEEKNKKIFGKCHQFHGHEFIVELSVCGRLAGSSGMYMNLSDLQKVLANTLEPWKYRNLNKCEPFEDSISTGELVVRVIRDRVKMLIPQKVSRLRVWETINNRFCLR